MLSGGSLPSWSATWTAKTVTVQLSPDWKSAFGLIVNVVGPPLTTVAPGRRVPVMLQAIWNQSPVTFTGSLNVMLTSLVKSVTTAPFDGVLAVTLGAASTVKSTT